MGDFLESIEIQMIYTGIARWVLVALAVYILVRCVVSLVRVSSPAEVWAYLHISRYGLDADGDVELLDERSEPITHWENVIGRAASCDIQVADEAISRNHGVLTRGTDGTWAYRDLGSKNGSYLEEVRISKEGEMGPPITMAYGDVHAAADQSGGTEQQSGNAKIGHKDDVDRADDGSAHTVSDFDDAAAVAGTGHRSSAEHFCQLWRTDAADVELCGDRARERTGGL